MCKSVIPQGNTIEDISYKHLAAIGLTIANIAELVKTQDLFVASLQRFVCTVIFTESEETGVLKIRLFKVQIWFSNPFQEPFIRNPKEITTLSGNEFLLQSDIDFLILDWFHAIKNAIDRLPKERSCTSRNLEFKLRRSSSIELLNSLDTESKEPKPEHRKSLIFRLNYSASDTNDRNRVKSRLKKFISRRPSLKTLQEKGLIKDQIFGSHLHLVCEHEKSTVPQFVRLCIKAVEKRGLDVDGIYRVSGNLATIQKLRFVVNQEEKLNLDDSQWEDIHVVTGALKMFFRELPEPLFPYCFFEQFVEAIKRLEEKASNLWVLKYRQKVSKIILSEANK
ncbi:PREDICTED: rho GTPase-activating protein 15-like [Tauraco erythrolophus]|uniref:rho GTPase-activating protein 15-like n=1 Tax=Tauraco erythrolophus TaxID=121530 RepID=UPI0005235462|nr:PREDICTED: rho GTPase-activating protein 15-like [Tauraco erythrolophus]